MYAALVFGLFLVSDIRFLDCSWSVTLYGLFYDSDMNAAVFFNFCIIDLNTAV
jgi:hypothetical protein